MSLTSIGAGNRGRSRPGCSQLRFHGEARRLSHELGYLARDGCAVHARDIPALGQLRPRPSVRGGNCIALTRAWSLGADPGDHQLVVDGDSTIREVFGRLKSGAAYGYAKVLGYHPILATRADTGEIVHARMRKGSADIERGTERFVEELVARLRRAGATGQIIIRFDSGYWSNEDQGYSDAWGVLHHGGAHGHKSHCYCHRSDR